MWLYLHSRMILKLKFQLRRNQKSRRKLPFLLLLIKRSILMFFKPLFHFCGRKEATSSPLLYEDDVEVEDVEQR